MARAVDIQALSEAALRMLQSSIDRALHVDDATAPGKPKPYGVREHPDFRQLNGELEAELKRRGLRFKAVDWDENDLSKID